MSFDQDGGAVTGGTTVRVGALDATFAAIEVPELRPAPVVHISSVTFTQSAGARTALPRRICKPPCLGLQPPLVWTTRALTLHAGGRTTIDLAGARPSSRHGVYDASRASTLNPGLAAWKRWLGQQLVGHTLGDQDSSVIVAAAETVLERELPALLMHGVHTPKTREPITGNALARDSEPGVQLISSSTASM